MWDGSDPLTTRVESWEKGIDKCGTKAGEEDKDRVDA